MAEKTATFGIVAQALSTDPRDAAHRARTAGFKGLLFDARTAVLDINALSITGRREFRHVLSSQDQALVGLRTEIGAKGLSVGADIDRVITQLGRVMESAAGLNAPLVCVELGPLPHVASSAAAKPKVTPEMAGLIILPETAVNPPAEPQPATPPADPAFVSQVDAAMIELGQRADRFGVVVAFRSELASFASLEAALRNADCPWFGVDLDPVAVLRDAWDLDEVFSRLGPLVRHVRVRDALVGADRRTRPAPVGHGSTNWEHFLSNLDAAGYRGWLTIDPIELPDRLSGAMTALSYLGKLRS